MVKNILITGASGFVGSYLRREIAVKWPDALTTCLGKTGDNGTGTLIPVNLLDPAAVADIVREYAPDIIVHLAAQSSVAVSITGEPDTTWSVNLVGSLNVATAVAAHAPEAIVLFSSTSEVYGASFLGGAVHEGIVAMPINAYAKSKLLAEQIFTAVLPNTTRLVVMRPFSHTGPGQREIFALPNFVSQLARIETGRQQPRMTVGNLDVRRDILDVRDVVAAYVRIIEAAPQLPPRFLCNIASGTSFLLRDIVESLRAKSATTFDIEVDPARLRKVDLPVACGDATLLNATIGWRPIISLNDTLDTLINAARAALST